MKIKRGQGHYKLTSGLRKRLFNSKFFAAPENVFVIIKPIINPTNTPTPTPTPTPIQVNSIKTEQGYSLTTELNELILIS